MRKVNVTSWISLRSLVLLLACSYIHSRLSRKSFRFSGNSGRGIQDRDKDEKPSFNLLKFITGSENDDDDSYVPFVNDDKRLAILSNQRSISRDELLENVIKGVISVIGMVFYYRMFSQLGDSFRSMGSSLMGAMKTDSKSDDYSALHPNVTKLLPANATLNSYEIEILQVLQYQLPFIQFFTHLNRILDEKMIWNILHHT
jgi:hypothetical protein